jgi:DNA-binding NarL/FixJ family response regulator
MILSRGMRLNCVRIVRERVFHDQYQTARTACIRPAPFVVEEVMATEIYSTFASTERAVRNKMLALVIAHRYDIAGAGIEAVLKAGGHSVIARCADEDDLLLSVEAYRPTMIVLAENIVRQEAAKTVLRLRACNCSVAIIFLLEERDAITAADLLALDVEGFLSNAACARSVIDCVESVRQGRKWVDPNLLRHLAMRERPSQIASHLTSREGEIARLVSRGLRNKEIARGLHLSEGTVKMHLHHIYEKLRLGGRTQLALSTTGACARMPGYEVCLPGKPACPDSAAALRLVAWRPPKNPDTAPGHIVAINLSGIKTGSTYTFRVRDLPYAPSANGEVDAYKPFTVTDGGESDLDREPNGQIVTTWTVHHDPDPVNATLSLTATGNDGTVVSTTLACSPAALAPRPATLPPRRVG